MIRQYYFPKVTADQPGWLLHFSKQLPLANAELGLPADAVTAVAADAAWLAYVWGPWFSLAQQFGPACTTAARAAAAPFTLPDWEETVDGFHACLHELFRVTPLTAIIIAEARFFIAAQQFFADRRLRVS